MATETPRSQKQVKKDALEIHQQPSKAKSTTRAERREKQNKDRAEKAAAKEGATAGKGGAKSAAKVTSVAGPSTQQQQARGAKPSDGTRISQSSRDVAHSLGQSESLAPSTRGLRIFSHFGIPKQGKALQGTAIHPAIFRLGLKFSEFKIIGANARCIAMLNTFKTVIRDYQTPSDQTIARHLTTYLSPQIGHLVSSRPMAVSMGNAIRYLKVEISKVDISLPEQDAKQMLYGKIDHYIRDNITIAGKVIQDVAADKIRDGDVVLTFARSSVVEKVLLQAHAQGKQFSIIVVDSRPLLEGKQLLVTLANAGIQCTYILSTALGAVIREVSLVLLGAHSVQADGAVYSRAGTALVAMMAKSHSVPTLVCCETYKFSEAVHLDSLAKNELAPATSLVKSYSTMHDREKLALNEQPNLQIMNPLYDLTPPSNITAIVTEVGTIPPNSVSSLPGTLGRVVQ